MRGASSTACSGAESSQYRDAVSDSVQEEATAPTAPVATVIADVVGSRLAPDRQGLHDRVVAVLDWANDVTQPQARWRITLGDEFQAMYADIGAALAATLMLQTKFAGSLNIGGHTIEPIDVRFGIGWGPVSTLISEPRVEDGPGWWAARSAIDDVKRAARRAGLRHCRTCFSIATGVNGPDPGVINSALVCRDQIIGSASVRSRRILCELLIGTAQSQIAINEGISASAVSQRVRHDGLAILVHSNNLFRRIG